MSTTAVRRIHEFNKAVLDVSIDTSRAVAEAVTDGASRALTTLRDTGATVAGPARAAVDRTAGDATTGIEQIVGQARATVDATAADVVTGGKQVVGQARAQGRLASERLDEISDGTARRATAAVDPSPTTGTPYEQWTRADLYGRAQELDVDGRSTMSKQQLIDALRAT